MTPIHSLKTIAGTAVLLRQNGEDAVCFNGLALGPKKTEVSIHTNFRMASISKQFTAACVILLKKRGELSYDDTLSKFFPAFRTGSDICLKHLLTHTSGLHDYERLIPADRTRQVADTEVLEWLSGLDSTSFLPGSRYRYSNSGFCILAEVVTKVSGMPYAEFVKEHILKPLNMFNSYVYDVDGAMPERALGYALIQGKVTEADQSVTSATKGDGCLYTSIADYSKWITALTQNTLFDLKEELKQVNYIVSEGLSYGLGWFNTNDELFHTGSTCGFSNGVWLTLDGRNALVYFSNLANHHAPAFELEKLLPFRKPVFSLGHVLALTD